MSATAELGRFNPFDPETLQCPYPHYARMREEAPVVFIETLGMYLVTRHDLILEVLRDPKTYSNMFGRAGMPLAPDDREKLEAVMSEGYPRVPTMLTADQPEHTRYRRLVAKAFSPRAIAELEPVIRATTERLIDSWIDQPRIEFVAQFGVPLPVNVIAKALNVPDSRLADFKRWSDDSIAGIGTNITIEQRMAAERGVNEYQHYFAAELEKRRTEPQDDLLTKLLEARIDDDDADVADKRPLDMAEMLSIIQQLLVAGNETTTKMLAEMMRLLGEHPDEWQKVRADPSYADAVVEETLRLATPTQGMWRIPTRDVVLAGVAIPAGARVVLVYSAANRDTEVFGADAEAFCPARENLNDHIAFGKGIHYCLGANLSRLEGRIALQALARRLASFRITENNDLSYFPSFMLRGLKRLEIDIEAAPMTTDKKLTGKIAVVTGASRGIGRGTAVALAEQGATVYVTGRTTGDGELTIDTTARLVDAAGGHGIPVKVDHGVDAQIAALFEQVKAEQGRLDILVNNVYKIPDPPAWGGGFWDHPISIWDDQVGIGLRAHYVASWHAAPLLFAAGPGGLIANVSSPGGQSYHFSSSYGAGKAGLDRLTADMAIELQPKGIAAVVIYPGSVSTEFILEWAAKRGSNPADAQTPLAVGRTIAALASASDLMDRSGSIQWVEDVAVEFGIVDEHGNVPPPYGRRLR